MPKEREVLSPSLLAFCPKTEMGGWREKRKRAFQRVNPGRHQFGGQWVYSFIARGFER